MSNQAEVTINSKGVTTIPYLVFKELDPGAICQALGIRIITPQKPKRRKR